MNDVDPLPTILLFFTLIILLTLSAVFSAAETAVLSLSKMRIDYLTKTDDKKAKRLKKITSNPEIFLQTVLIANNLVNTCAVSIATWIAMQIFKNAAAGIATGIMTFLILIFGEITPKNIAREKPEKIALKFSGIINISIIVLSPIFFVISFLNKTTKKIFKTKNNSKVQNITEEDLKILLEVGAEEGVLQKNEKKMLSNVLQFTDLTVKEIMTPRTDIQAIKGEMSYSELLQFSKEKGLSRFPYYDKDLDNILGIIYIKDLIYVNPDNSYFSIMDLLRPATFVFESKTISKMQEELVEQKQNMAIVLDEYGGTAGLVTLEDIVEEVFGSITDEYDLTNDITPIKLSAEAFIIDASIRLQELSDITECDFISDSCDTVAGLILEKYGNIPETGDEILINGWTFKVEKLLGKRITKVKVYKNEEKLTDE